MYNIKKIIEYVEKKYKEKPEYLWKKFPEFAVFRHSDNRKWFMLLAKVDKTKLSMDIDYNEKLQNEVEIMNVKCDPNMIDAIVNNKSIIRSYHMNKKHWITVILDGSLKDSNINELIDISFGMTGKKNNNNEVQHNKDETILSISQCYNPFIRRCDMAKFKVTANTGSVEIEAYDIEEAIRKFKDLNNSAEIESVEKTDKW